MSLQSFADVNQALKRFIPTPRQFEQARFSLQDMKRLLEYLGNPQDTYRVVHIAGTSGKTSTSYYMAALLQATGKKVGMTVSPHVAEVNERVQLNLEPLPVITFTRYFDEFLQLIDQSDIQPSYFAVLVSFAYWVFAKEQVDYAVIEVGMGGLMDATNVVTRPDKTCVITDIDLDHTEFLGNTLAEIAAQKTGIVRPHNIVFSYDQNDEIMNVLREVCDQQQAELHEVWPLSDSELPKNLPLFQRKNWYLALSVYRYLAQRDGLSELTEQQLATTTETHIPARMETFERGKKIVILDGAHNAQKLEALVRSIRARYPNQDIALLFGLAQTKGRRTRSSIGVATKFAHHIIITSFAGEQDIPKVSVPTKSMAEECKHLGYNDWEIVADSVAALGVLLRRPEPVLLVAGSFYLLNHIRPLMLEKS